MYDAALYTEPGARAEEVLSGNYAFTLRFDYLRAIDKDLAIRYAGRALERNLHPTELSSIADRVRHLNSAYRSVQKGDGTLLVYQPELGTSYYFNDEKVLTLPGKDGTPVFSHLARRATTLSARATPFSASTNPAAG